MYKTPDLEQVDDPDIGIYYNIHMEKISTKTKSVSKVQRIGIQPWTGIVYNMHE